MYPHFVEGGIINAWQKYKIQMGFEPEAPEQKANTTTTELKRILPKVLCLNREAAMLEGVVSCNIL